MSKSVEGKVITARGPVEPGVLGAVMMHEHLHSDWAQVGETPFDMVKWPMLEKYAVPSLRELRSHGCFAYVDMSRAPERAAPWVYKKVSELSDIHIVVATGFYREMELGKYWTKTPEDQIWPFVRDQPVEVLEEFCVREVEEGIHGSDVHAGVLKAASSSAELTEAERKAFIAVARAHKKTGIFISTHCTAAGAHVTQLELLESSGVNPERVILGHTERHMVNEWPTVRDCMKRGTTFLMTNLRMDVAEKTRQQWADAIKRAFDEGLGDHVTLGLDWAFTVGYAEMTDPNWRPHLGDTNMITSCTFMPPPPFVYLFTYTIPRFREMGVTDEMIRTMTVDNPKRIMPVQS